MQKSPDPGRRGRRPAFDRRAVVEAALRAFWTHGFEGATLGELERVTGADRSTLYNSFGGKVGLYREAATAYVDATEAEVLAPLHEGTDGIGDVVEFLARLARRLGSARHPPGCLIVNDLTSAVPDRGATRRYLTSLDEGCRAALSRAVRRGELSGSGLDERRRLLVAAVLGALVTHRHDAPDTRSALDMIEAVRATVATRGAGRGVTRGAG